MQNLFNKENSLLDHLLNNFYLVTRDFYQSNCTSLTILMNELQISTIPLRLNLLHVIFENDIFNYEIPAFRGAVSKIAGFENILFHNHIGNSLRYSYPLIQYKTLQRKPMLICLEKGVNEAHHFFQNIQEGILLGEREYELKINKLELSNKLVSIDNVIHSYKMLNWLPFNQDNIKTYSTIQNEMDKLLFLEKILIGNIISFAKGITWNVTDKIWIRIEKLEKKKPISIKGSKRIAMDIEFQSNVLMPSYLGLGKNTSIGFGTVIKADNKKYKSRA